jgi:hypothetical protein
MIKPYSNEPTGQSRRSIPPREQRSGRGSIVPAADNLGNTMVLATITSVILSTIVGVAWITPLLQAGAVFPFFYVAMRRRGADSSLALVARWAGAVLVTTIVLGAFVPARMDASQLLSARTVSTLEAWLTSAQAPPPADYSYILWGMAIFLVGSVISGGLAGFVVGSLGLGAAATGALFLFEHGGNVVQIALTALPPWQWALFAGGALLLVPAATPFFDRFVRSEVKEEDRRPLRLHMYAGAACFVLSVLLRLTTAGAWQQILQSWTDF